MQRFNCPPRGAREVSSRVVQMNARQGVAEPNPDSGTRRRSGFVSNGDRHHNGRQTRTQLLGEFHNASRTTAKGPERSIPRARSFWKEAHGTASCDASRALGKLRVICLKEGAAVICSSPPESDPAEEPSMQLHEKRWNDVVTNDHRDWSRHDRLEDQCIYRTIRMIAQQEKRTHRRHVTQAGNRDPAIEQQDQTPASMSDEPHRWVDLSCQGVTAAEETLPRRQDRQFKRNRWVLFENR